MSKQVIKNYIFDTVAKTLTLPDFDTLDLGRLALITNATTGTVLYNFVDASKTATVSGNVITLSTSLVGMSNTDKIRIDYDTIHGDTNYDRVTVGNARNKFRDGFAGVGAQPNTGIWDVQNDNAGHIITQGGDSFGSSYLRISLSPFVDNSGVTLTSKRSFKFPMRVGFGVTTSQRILGQEVFFGMVGTDSSGNVDVTADTPDVPITGTTAAVTSNVATFAVAGHGLKGGDRVEVEFCTDKRMNVGPVTVTVIDYNTISLPVTIGNGSYSTVGGVIRIVDPFRNAKNGAGLLLENTSVSNASFVARRNASKFRSLNTGISTTTAVQSSTSPYTDAFNSASTHELYYSLDEVMYRSYTSDSASAGMTGIAKFSQGIPDEDPDYKIQLRARNLTGITMPVAKITTIAKTGTTTATVTTSAPHGLATTDFVQIYGVADQTNFPNLTSQTQVASVISPTQFTIVIGGAVTASSTAGAIWQVQGSVLAPGVFGQVVQSISQTSQILTVIGNSAWTAGLPGEYVHLYGLNNAASAYEGAYKILRVTGTTLELQGSGADFTSITTGGAVIRRTDVRFHYTRVMDYTRLVTEISGGKGSTSDINNSVPVSITGSATIATSQSSGSASSQWSAAGFAGMLANDAPAAALTSTTTTGAINPGQTLNVGAYAHSFNVVVTAVSGTSPTFDLSVEESIDNGTNWVRIYDFPRITANGAYTSPLIRAQFGTRYRYVQTVGGTSPSFTRSINRLMFSSNGPLFRQFIDRTITPNTVNATTPAPFYNVDGANAFQLTVNMGAVTTTAPVFQLQGSEDGTNWFAFGGTLTATASTTVNLLVKDVAMPKFVRVFVQSAGVGATLGYVTVKAFGA